MKKHALLIAPGMAIVLLFPGGAARFCRLGFIQFIDAKRNDYLRWDRAGLQLFNLWIAPQAGLYAVYAELGALCRNNSPGENRDGVLVFKTK